MSIRDWTRRLSRRDGAAAPHDARFNERELFYRDLSECHLLIDFVSGRTDKSLLDLKDVADVDIHGKSIASMPPQRVVEEICKISYPPEGGREATAQQAAFMLVVKDRLNYLAAPARGLSVAFTSMFAGVSLDIAQNPLAWLGARARRLWLRWFKGEKAAFADLRREVRRRRRRDFFSALAAYPNLEAQARNFRRFYNLLPGLAVLLVTFIIYVNWDVSVTSGLLDDITMGQCRYARFLNGEKAPVCALPPGPPPAATNCGSAAACADVINGDRKTLDELVGAGHYLHPMALSFRLLGVPGEKTAAPIPPSTPQNLLQPWRTENFARDVIAGLNAIIIPTAFGWLGTLAGLMRSITAKVKESVLSPRDHTVARIGMCLGMSAGLAVGLFISDPSLVGAQPLGKTITITSAGLSFLAGFGAETFFTFLDSVLVRLLPILPPPSR
jgi:hypothetical protein